MKAGYATVLVSCGAALLVWCALHPQHSVDAPYMNVTEAHLYKETGFLWNEGIRAASARRNVSYIVLRQHRAVINTQLSTEFGASSTLYVGSTDWTFPTQYNPKLVEDIYQKYERIFAQNLCRSSLTAAQSAKTVALPIGLPFHDHGDPKLRRHWTRSSWQQYQARLVHIYDTAPISRIPKVLITWHKNDHKSRHSPPYRSRKTIYRQAQTSPELYAFVSGDRNLVWETMAQYAFVYSPIGNGYDCYRTWEALALGCIVIAQDNPTVREFIDDYPIVPDDGTLAGITPGQLEEWSKTMPRLNRTLLLAHIYI